MAITKAWKTKRVRDGRLSNVSATPIYEGAPTDTEPAQARSQARPGDNPYANLSEAELSAGPAFSQFRDYITERRMAGAEFMPMDGPRASFNQTRDALGDYTSQGFAWDYGGVNDAVAGISRLREPYYTENLGHDMADANSVRKKVRDAVGEPETYYTSRLQATPRSLASMIATQDKYTRRAPNGSYIANDQGQYGQYDYNIVRDLAYRPNISLSRLYRAG